MSEPTKKSFSLRDYDTRQDLRQISNSIGAIFEPDYSDSPELQSEDYVNAALTTGATTALSGAAIGSLVPVIGTGIGAAAGFAVGMIGSLLSADKKREAYEKKWKADLRRYKDALRGQVSNVKATKKKTQATIVKSTHSIAEGTQKNVERLIKMTQAQALGVTDVKGTQLIKETEEEAETTIEDIYDMEMAKFAKLGQLQAAIDAEISAGRGYGQIRTDQADEIQRLSSELAEGNYV